MNAFQPKSNSFKMKNIFKYIFAIIISCTGSGLKAQYDADAQKFIDSTGITNTVQKNAINQLVVSLKDSSLWSKMKAVYPFAGSTETTQKFNLKDPRNLDAAFRLTFHTTVTHSSTGFQTDGTSGYANTHLVPNSNSLAYDDNHFSFYSNTSDAGNSTLSQYYEMGSGNSSAGGYSLFLRRGDNSAAYDAGNGSTNRATFTNSNGSGFYVGTATSSTGYLYKNGSQQASHSNSSSTIVGSYEIFLGGFNEDGSNTYYSNKQCRFASIGLGLTSTEAGKLYHIVTDYLSNLEGSGSSSSGSDTNWVRSGSNLYFNNGNVGIGTSSPETKLAVNGYISAKKLIVTQSGWPDYVFDKNYKLPSLEELEKYINAHKHLPGIIPAKDIEMNGLNVGDNQAALLKKIEELTLIVIDLNKKIEALEKSSKK